MAGITYKCPSCGGYLNFDPDGGQWKCPFCHSTFQEDQLLTGEGERTGERPDTASEKDGAQVTYHCPSCGSQIVTDETTVATHCYYCHSPVVLQGKLTDDMRPDGVLPFAIDQQKATTSFMDWVWRKRFVPKGFFSEQQVREMTGVYYPHFVTDCEAEGAIDGEGRQVSVAETPKYIITSTRHYHVRREGLFKFRGIMRPALSSTDRKLSDGIHPFPLEDAKPFAGAYLSGFVAERRDLWIITDDIYSFIRYGEGPFENVLRERPDLKERIFVVHQNRAYARMIEVTDRRVAQSRAFQQLGVEFQDARIGVECAAALMLPMPRDRRDRQRRMHGN